MAQEENTFWNFWSIAAAFVFALGLTLIIAAVVSSDTFSVNGPVFVFGVKAMLASPFILLLDNLTRNFFPNNS